MGQRRGFIGDAHLKKYRSGTLAKNTPITENEYKIYYTFVKGIKASRIIDAMEHEGAEIEEHEFWDIIRRVGMECQEMYRASVSTPFDLNKTLFSEFVKGIKIEQILEDYTIPAQQLFKIIRKVGYLYLHYNNKTGFSKK